jgi:hypothetical protein
LAKGYLDLSGRPAYKTIGIVHICGLGGRCKIGRVNKIAIPFEISLDVFVVHVSRAPALIASWCPVRIIPACRSGWIRQFDRDSAASRPRSTGLATVRALKVAGSDRPDRFGRVKGVILRRGVEIRAIANSARGFFDVLKESPSALSYEEIGKLYCEYFWQGGDDEKILNERKIAKSRFQVNLNFKNASFADVTKRSMLVSNSLLLTEKGSGEPIKLKEYEEQRHHPPLHLDYVDHHLPLGGLDGGYIARTTDISRITDSSHEYIPPTSPTRFELKVECSNFARLGRWVIEAEPLLRKGLVWYLPAYVTHEIRYYIGNNHSVRDANFPPKPYLSAIDFLKKDGQAIDGSGSIPDAYKVRVVRNAFSIELPFVDALNLRDYSEVTASEFDSFRRSRKMLQEILYEIGSPEDLDYTIKMMKAERAINQRIDEVRAKMRRANRTKAVQVSGVGFGIITATLFQVFGSTLQAAMAAVGITGSTALWAAVEKVSEVPSKKDLTEGEWYYIWALSQRSERLF